MTVRLRALLRCTRGASAVEYALICALIVMAVVGGITALGGGLTNIWGSVSNAVSTN